MSIGSNQILLNQILQFQLRYPFFTYKKGIGRTREEIKRFELKNGLSDQSDLKKYVKSSVWYP